MDIKLQSVPGRLASAITDAFDSQETRIPNEGITQDTVLTLSGTGTVNSGVFIFDNQTLLRTASVITPGIWTLRTTVLLGRHAFTVRDELAGADSLPYVITVNEAELDLREPIVTQAPGGTLNPVDAISGATVVVTYDMLPTDTIGLSWNGLDDLVSPQPGNAIGSVTFTIPASAVAAVIGKTIPVQYAVVRNSVAKPSQVLSLTVQTLADSVLEAPRILQATDDLNLDVSALTGDADLRVKPWPFIEAGQQISLRFEGTRADGTAYNWAHPVWQNFPISSTVEPSTTVALSDLKELKDGSSLRLIFEVSFDGGITTVLFPVRVLNIIQVAASGFEDFEAAAPGTLPHGTSLTLGSGLRLRVFLQPQAAPVAIARASSPQGEHGFQYFSVGVNAISFSESFLAFPDGKFTTVEFTIWAADNVSGQRLAVVFYDDGGTTQQLVYVAPVGSKLPVKYTAPAGAHITELRLANGAGNPGSIAFDSLRWSA